MQDKLHLLRYKIKTVIQPNLKLKYRTHNLNHNLNIHQLINLIYTSVRAKVNLKHHRQDKKETHHNKTTLKYATTIKIK